MSILTNVEAKSRNGKLFLAGVTTALLLGSVTMIYPMMIMLSGAMRSEMDASDMSPLPKYMFDDQELVQKFLETKYNYDTIMMNELRQGTDYSFRTAAVPQTIDSRVVNDFEEFVEAADLPDHWRILGGTEIRNFITSYIYLDFAGRVRQRYNDDLHALNRDLGSPLQSWAHLSLRIPPWTSVRFPYSTSPVYEEYFKLMRERPLAETSLISLTGSFLRQVIYPRHGMIGVERYNQKHVRPIESYEQFAVPRLVPSEAEPLLRAEWLEFVRHDFLNLSFIRADVPDEAYQVFLHDRYKTVDNLKRYWHDAAYESFADIRLPGDREWVPDYRRQAYREFIATLAPEQLRLVGPEFEYQDFLQRKYGDVAALNAAYGAEYSSWLEPRMPIAQVETKYVQDNSGTFRRRFASRNFRVVFNEVFIQGRPFANSIIYVLLALLFALTLQPLVAYSLSRFDPPGVWKIVFIFVATMAFPPMVAMIPQFLIIQKLGLINTFIALVLPVTINGYLIFLLKGFFDSIPQDLYSAALIDGASELRMFRHITLALSGPILAVVALQTFNAAWMAFMYPLIVCPDEKMHVLAVWLQQFQRQAPGPAVFASILIASVPSLIIFVFAQRTIMRGIAVPAEK